MYGADLEKAEFQRAPSVLEAQVGLYTDDAAYISRICHSCVINFALGYWICTVWRLWVKTKNCTFLLWF